MKIFFYEELVLDNDLCNDAVVCSFFLSDPLDYQTTREQHSLEWKKHMMSHKDEGVMKRDGLVSWCSPPCKGWMEENQNWLT